MESILTAYDLLRFTQGHLPRLSAARATLKSLPDAPLEWTWLSTVLEALEEAAHELPSVLEGARALPELLDVRMDFAMELQGRWVDSVEKLHAGITFHVGGRTPVLEALFPHQKFQALRKGPYATATAYAADFERRLKSTYVTRMMAGPEFAFAPAVIAQVTHAAEGLLGCLSPTDGGSEQSDAAKASLLSLATRLDRLIQQSRLIAQAALLPLPGAFDASGLNAKPRKRAPTSDSCRPSEGFEAKSEETAPLSPPPQSPSVSNRAAREPR